MTTSLSISDLKKLYEQDIELWRKNTIQQIRAQQFSEIDWEHLLEELEEMSKSDKQALTSNLVILIAHLLKLQIQFDVPDSMKGSWYESVNEHRFRVKDDLQEKPSLKSYLAQALTKAYSKARSLAIKDSKNAKWGVRKPLEKEYPLDCPFTLEQILDDDFYLLMVSE